MRIPDFLERPKSRDLLADWYANALDDQETSGLSVPEYANAMGVSAATLYQWRRRLSEQGDSADPDPSARLIEVTIEREPGRTTSSGFTLRLGQGRSIEVPGDFDEIALTRLIGTLESC